MTDQGEGERKRVWEEFEPGKWGFRYQDPWTWQRSTLPAPTVISDEMPPTEQVDGKFYTSKSAFRATGRALGLTEVGTAKVPPKRRSTEDERVRHARRQALRKAAAQFRSGQRARPHG